MVALIGGFLGLFTSLAPELLKFFRQKADQKHELKVMALQLEHEKIRHKQKIEEINVQADIAESKALEKRAEVKYTGVKWIDAFLALLNSSVRPTVTYYFVVVYGLVKYAMYSIALGDMDPAEALISIWNKQDEAILAMVLTYWFGQRAWKYAQEKWATK